MAVTVEVSYSNSFYLKRLAGADSSSGVIADGYGKKWSIPLPPQMAYRVLTGFTQNNQNTGYPWNAPMTANSDQDWYIEEARIRGGYNNTFTDLGVKAYIVSDEPNQTTRGNSLIYSGIFNSRTGINQTNQFSIAEEITRSVDPKGGTIQKLFAEDTNLTVFQERKVNVALIDKDAIYTAEGQPMTTTSNVVIGQITPVPGNWGIGTNPESFATYGYTKYFVDKDRNAVLKIEGAQIQEISEAGMMDFFRDQLSSVTSYDALLGSYDVYNKNYVLSIQTGGTTESPARYNVSTPYKTLTFDERNKGWTSFFTYKPESYFSCKGQFYSTTTTPTPSGGTLTSSITINTTDGTPGTYNPAAYTLSGSNGTGMVLSVTVDVHLIVTDVTIVTGGSGYEAGDRIVVSQSVIGGTKDLTILLTNNDLEKIQSVSRLYKHYSNPQRNTFYDTYSDSSLQFIFNPMPNFIKTFKTINYEGNSGWEVTSLISDSTGLNASVTPSGGWLSNFDTIVEGTGANQYSKIYSYAEGTWVDPNTGVQYRAGFDRKQNKYYAVIPNNTTDPMAGEVIWGNQISGIKAYYSTVTMKTDTTTDPKGLKSLFAVSSEYINR